MTVRNGANTRIDSIVWTLITLTTVVMILMTIINQLLVCFEIIINCIQGSTNRKGRSAARVSAKRKFCYISHRDAATRLAFLRQFYMLIINHISQNQLPTCSNRLEKIYMVEYCDFFKWHFRKF